MAGVRQGEAAGAEGCQNDSIILPDWRRVKRTSPEIRSQTREVLLFLEIGRGSDAEFLRSGRDIVWHGNCMMVGAGDCLEDMSQLGRNASIADAIAEHRFCSLREPL